MTRTEAFDKAWRIAFKEKDFSLVDEIYHPEYAAYDDRTGINVNLEADKTVVLTLKETITFGPSQTVSENGEFQKYTDLPTTRIQRYLSQLLQRSPTKTER